MDARRLLDGMRRRKLTERAVPPVDGRGTSIDDLPDGVLGHILGFLPYTKAVQTSFLARRWRHLWKSATGLHIGCIVDLEPVEERRSLVNNLLLLRGGSPLDTCEFTFGNFNIGDDVRHVNLWFRQAVICRARVLRLQMLIVWADRWLELDNLPLVSEHWTRLELEGVQVHDSFLNLSTCPALKYLQIVSCDLSLVTKISSDSLKHLCIKYSQLCYDSRIRIYAPNLVSLCLDGLWERTPILYIMPSLVKAFVRIDGSCLDRCNGANYGTCDCESCDSSVNMVDGSSNSVLLKGVSDATNLALISESEMFIFKRDLRWCPMFRKLKTLLLNDYWCVPDDFRALACILEHSPVLEKLTLQLFSEGQQPEVEMKLSVSSTKRSAAISEYLKKVELKCKVVDDRVIKVLKLLSTFDICDMQAHKSQRYCKFIKVSALSKDV